MSSFVVPMNHAFAASPETKFPTSSTSVDISLNKNWSNPDNVKVSDNANASVRLDPLKRGQYISNYLVVRNFGFADITGDLQGITVSIERSASDSSIKDYGLYLSKDGCETFIGNDKSVGSAWGASEATVVRGGVADKWGTTLTTSDLYDPEFAVCYAVYNNSANAQTTAYIDHITVSVHTSTSGLTGQNTGFHSPSSFDQNTPGTIVWANTDKTANDDQVYSTFTTGTATDNLDSKYLIAKGFFDSSSIPSTANNIGLIVNINGKIKCY